MNNEQEFINLVVEDINIPNNFNFNKRCEELISSVLKDSELSSEPEEVITRFIKTYAKPCYEMEIVEGVPTPTDSSIGGIPYVPTGESIPTDEDGNPMLLFVQLNLEGTNLPGYPSKGILQVFLSTKHDDMLDSYEVKYYDTITDDYQKDIVITDEQREDGLVKGDPIKIKLVESISVMPTGYSLNPDFGKAILPIYNNVMKTNYEDYEDLDGDEYEQIEELLFEFSEMTPDATFGGYAHNCQHDEYDYVENEILIQVVDAFSDDMGLYGLIRTLITKENLKTGNVTNVDVDWMCD